MKRLLALYIPATSRLYSFYLAASFLLIVAIKMLPLEDLPKDVLQTCVISLPMIVFYFSAETYLPNSLNWILLTPTSKKSILTSNIIINLYKLILITLGIILLSTYSYNLELYTFILVLWEGLSQIEFNHIIKIFSFKLHADIYLILTLISGICIALVAVLFGGSWVPDYSSISFISKPKQYLKRNGHWILILLFLYLYFSDSKFATYFFPPVIKYSMAISLGFFVAVNSTLNSLRTYYSKPHLRIVMIVFFVFHSSFFYFFINRDLQDSKISASSKMELATYLGPFAKDRYDVVLKELKINSKLITHLDRETFKDFLLYLPNESHKLIFEWKKLCEENNDYHCRLTHLALEYGKDYSLSILNKGCTNDIESCFLLYSSNAVNEEMRKKAKNRLEAACPSGVNHLEVCRSYLRTK